MEIAAVTLGGIEAWTFALEAFDFAAEGVVAEDRALGDLERLIGEVPALDVIDDAVDDRQHLDLVRWSEVGLHPEVADAIPGVGAGSNGVDVVVLAAPQAGMEPPSRADSGDR